MTRCVKCGAEFGGQRPVATISASIMGNEHTDAYYLCGGCGTYTVVLYVDHFLGEETASGGEPLSRKEGDGRVALIARCPRPWDKGCRCPAHLEYFAGYALD